MSQESPITPEAEDAIVNLLVQGFSSVEVAEELGWSDSQVRKIRRKAVEDGRLVVDAMAGVDTSAVAKAYDSGDPIREISKKFKLRVGLIYRCLQIEGVEIRKYNTTWDAVRKRQFDEAEAMYRAGMLIHEIVAEVGISQVTIHNELRRRGVPFRRPRDKG